MVLLVQAGLSPQTVLQAGTINAAETLGIGDRYDTVEIGKVADLILVDRNPLEGLGVLEEPTAVVKNGQ